MSFLCGVDYWCSDLRTRWTAWGKRITYVVKLPWDNCYHGRLNATIFDYLPGLPPHMYFRLPFYGYAPRRLVYRV